MTLFKSQFFIDSFCLNWNFSVRNSTFCRKIPISYPWPLSREMEIYHVSELMCDGKKLRVNTK